MRNHDLISKPGPCPHNGAYRPTGTSNETLVHIDCFRAVGRPELSHRLSCPEVKVQSVPRTPLKRVAWLTRNAAALEDRFWWHGVRPGSTDHRGRVTVVGPSVVRCRARSSDQPRVSSLPLTPAVARLPAI